MFGDKSKKVPLTAVLGDDVVVKLSFIDVIALDYIGMVKAP